MIKRVVLSPEKQLANMIAIVAEAFKNDMDKGGQPYILHCLHVMTVVGKKTNNDHEAMTIAVGHDLLEDHPDLYHVTDLQTMGFSDRVITGIVTMTHPKDEPYMVYVKRVGENLDTRLIKKVDIDHNSKVTRIKGIRDKDIERIRKYHEAYVYLESLD